MDTITPALITFAFLLLSLLLTFLLAAYWQPTFLVRFIAQRFQKVRFSFSQGKSTPRVLALTIDDALSVHTTSKILDVLKEFDVRATFFIIGSTVKNYRSVVGTDLLVRMREEGHELGNHLWKDEPSISLSPEEFVAQIAAVDNLIFPKETVSSLEKKRLKWLRPGSGWFNARMVRQTEEAGYDMVLGNVYPNDPSFSNVAMISWFIMNRVRPGSIIILHDRAWTIDVLRRVLPRLKEQGYKINTLSETSNETAI